MSTPDWNALLGRPPSAHCGRVYASRPEWIAGYISHEDANFLFARALESRADRVVEIGTASGLSTAILCHALHAANLAGWIGDGFRVDTYDIDPRFYADRAYASGDAAREMLSDDLLAHVAFHAPATSADVHRDHAPGSLRFAFIDASHQHPWPALDLLRLLPAMSAGGEVLLHDINLPLKSSGPGDWGAKHLFDGLDLEKLADSERDPPNIGMVRIPDDNEALREQLLALIGRHEWETEIQPEVLAAAGVEARA